MKHDFELMPDGSINLFALEGGYHNGPACRRCRDAWCHHCEPAILEEECPGYPLEQHGQLPLFGEDE